MKWQDIWVSVAEEVQTFGNGYDFGDQYYTNYILFFIYAEVAS